MNDTVVKVKKHRNGMVHFVLVHSYLVFLCAILLGALLDPLISKKMFTGNVYQNIGLFMLAISSIIIYWAQKSSSNYLEKRIKKETRSRFEFGPYKYLRSPTHFGLFIMTLGFSLIINSFFGVILTLVAYLITKMIFLKKEEKLLAKKYGQIYLDYKKKVKNWI